MTQTTTTIDQLEQINESLDLGTKQGQQQIQDLQQLQRKTMTELAKLKRDSQGTLEKVQAIQPEKAKGFPRPAIFAAVLAGVGGLLVGIAIGTTYIAPIL